MRSEDANQCPNSGCRITTALYNIVEAYSNWLYREFGEPNPSIRPRTIKNFLFRIYLIVIYYPLIYPLLFLAELDRKVRVWRLNKALYRLLRDPRSDRAAYYKVCRRFVSSEDAEDMADTYAAEHKRIYRQV